MSNKEEREQQEMLNILSKPKYARQVWRTIGMAILTSPATSISSENTLAGEIERYSYESLKNDISSIANPDASPYGTGFKRTNREPTELEMIMRCQAMRARFDTSAATFIRDTVGGKPIDETKVEATVSNPYESLTDEELLALQEMREAKSVAAASDPTPTQKE